MDSHLFWIHSGHAFVLKRHNQPAEVCRHLKIAEWHYGQMKDRGDKPAPRDLVRLQAVQKEIAACSNR